MMTVVVSNHLECLFLKIRVNWHSISSSRNVDEDAAEGKKIQTFNLHKNTYIILFKYEKKLTLLCYIRILLLFSSVTQLCPTHRNPMDCSTSSLPVHHQLPEFTQTCVH